MTRYTAAITGASNGIGLDLAQRLLDRDYHVISIDRDPPQITHARMHTIEADLLNMAAVNRVAETLASSHKVTHLIHNAGLIRPNLLEEATPEDITGLAQLHLGGGAAPDAGCTADDEG